MNERGALERLIIRAYKKPDHSASPVGQFEAYVNPNEITLAYEIEYDEAQGSGTTKARMKFKKMKPAALTLAFFLDGTGANGRPLDVQRKVEEFQKVTDYNGDTHEPNYLKIGWGNMTVMGCVLKSASIAYKMWRSDGVPLRAVITAVFSSSADDKTRVALAQDKSPDLTRVRLIKAGDTLPSLCQEFYGNPRLYVAVAEANGLDDLRTLTPGTRIFFPPLEK